MDKWNVLRGFIAKEHNDIRKKYLADESTGNKANNAQIIITTLETVWKAMDEIEKIEKEKQDEPDHSDREPNERT